VVPHPPNLPPADHDTVSAPISAVGHDLDPAGFGKGTELQGIEGVPANHIKAVPLPDLLQIDRSADQTESRPLLSKWAVRTLSLDEKASRLRKVSDKTMGLL